MRTCILYLVIALILSIYAAQGQSPSTTSETDSTANGYWMAGAGYTVVDDSGDVFDRLFAVRNQWNALPYPSRISLGRYFANGLGLELIGSYNEYKEGKIIDGQINDRTKPYWAVDSRFSYDLNKLLGETGWFDPYVGVGVGYTRANEQPRGTYNAVIGFRTWLSDRWGLDFSSSGKWSFGTTASNHLQHAAGVVYKIADRKNLPPDAMEEQTLTVIENQQSEGDSLLIKQQEEQQILARETQLAHEQEALLKHNREKEALAIQDLRRDNIRKELDALGDIYFNLNSSYLNQESKRVLDAISSLLARNSEVELMINSHADSRGTQAYNTWLSDRRAQRTVQYLISAGIAGDRVKGAGLGESQLVNHCTDGITCTEPEHKENRRSEFEIIKF